jgi:replicative DNA helicase
VSAIVEDDWESAAPAEAGRARAAGRVAPHNLEAEASLLGAMLLSSDAVATSIETVQAVHFYRPLHRMVFEAAWDLYSRSEPVDHVTVAQELSRRGQLEQVGGLAFLAELASAVPATVNAAHYGKIVRDNFLLRELIRVGRQIAEMGFEAPDDVRSIIDRAEGLVYEVSQGRGGLEFASMSDLMHRAYQAIEHRYDHKAPVTGLPSGYTDLDKYTSGFQDGNLVIVAARPSMGKTALALNFAANAALHSNVGVAIFSLEMSAEEVAERLLCSEAKVDSKRVRSGFLQDADWPRITRAAGKLEAAPIFVDESPFVSVLEMRAKARRMASKAPLGMIVVDYVQLMEPRDGRQENRAAIVADISRGLKILAREVGVPVIACAQLNRGPESRNDKRPLLGDLRESGSLEQDADIVMFIYRDSYYHDDSPDKGLAEVILAKNRNGPTGNVHLSFLDHCTRFENVAAG